MSDAIARPTPPEGFSGFSIRNRYRRMQMETPGYEDVWASVRTNLTHGERRDFFIATEEFDERVRDRIKANAERFKKINEAIAAAKSDKERAAAWKRFHDLVADQVDGGIEDGRQKFRLVAPYVNDWNVCDDQFQPVPPPSEGADAAFEWIDDQICAWLITALQEAYKGGPKGKSSSSESEAPPEPPPAPTTASDPEP